MAKQRIYINAAHSISPQPTFENGFFDDALIQEPKSFLQILAPKYAEYIPPKKLRRMTKLMRLGLVQSHKVLEEARLEHPDAIIVGSGNGNISDTQKFLNSLIDNGERMLVPTSFVQSTPNIVSGSIALKLSNKGYNMTYCHHNAAFEMSLLDAKMLIEEGAANNVLVGGLDEITEENVEIRSGSPLWIKRAVNPLEIFAQKMEGALLGESSAFFMLSTEKTESSYAEFVATESAHFSNFESVKPLIRAFIEKAGFDMSAIDLVLLGLNGVDDYDLPQLELVKESFPKAAIGGYKQFTGEHPTASAFAFWMAAKILSGSKIPAVVFHPASAALDREVKTILIFQKDYLTGKDFAVTLLRKLL